jgi:hypothetical protein
MSGIAASALVLRYRGEAADGLPAAGRPDRGGSGQRRAAGGRRGRKRRGRGEGDSRPGDLSVFYGAGAVAGFAPEDIRRMTLAEWHVVVAAFIAAHGPPEAGGSEDEFLAVLAEEMAAGQA